MPSNVELLGSTRVRVEDEGPLETILRSHTLLPLPRLVIKTQGQVNSRHGEMDFTFLMGGITENVAIFNSPLSLLYS